MLHSYAAAAIVSYALLRFCETIDLLVLKRNHYNKETKMRKSRTTLIEKTLVQYLQIWSKDLCYQELPIIIYVQSNSVIALSFLFQLV